MSSSERTARRPGAPTVAPIADREGKRTRVLVTGADSVEVMAAYIGMLGLDFHVSAPAELVSAVAALGERYRRAVDG